MKERYRLVPSVPNIKNIGKIRVLDLKPIKFIELSIKNRVVFLNKKKLEWDTSPERKQNQIVADLLVLEPSHLKIQWIADEVVKWKNNFPRYENYLRDAFSKKSRDALTERQKQKRIENAMLELKIEIIRLIENTSKAEAYKICVNKSDDDSLPDDAEPALKQRVKRYRSAVKKRVLPLPYFGKEVVLRGNYADIYAPLGSKVAFNGYVDNYNWQVSHAPGVLTVTDKPILSLPMPFDAETFYNFLKAIHPHAF